MFLRLLPSSNPKVYLIREDSGAHVAMAQVLDFEDLQEMIYQFCW